MEYEVIIHKDNLRSFLDCVDSNYPNGIRMPYNAIMDEDMRYVWAEVFDVKRYLKIKNISKGF